MKDIRFVTLVAAILATGLIGPARSPAAEKDHAAGHHSEGMHAQKPGAAAPASAGALWGAVKSKEAELVDLVKAKKLDQVHQVAFSIRDLVAALPDKSAGLPPDRLAKLKGNVKYVATLAERLDAAGDKKDQAATETSFRQLQSVLKAIEALYPNETVQ